MIVDARSNTLLVKGTEADHQLVENLLRRVALPAKQVLVPVDPEDPATYEEWLSHVRG